ncbi:response regulator [bacterium]|nr:response regulator [bacterium]
MAGDPLSQQPELYRLTVETMVQGLAVLDADARVLYANEALARLLGRPLKGIAGSQFVELFDTDAQEEFRRQIDRRHKGERGLYEITFFTAAGERVVGLVSAAPLIDARGQVVASVAVITDITARKLAEEAQRAQREQLRALSSTLVLTEERERRRLATQLHDRIGHALVVAKIKLEELAKDAERSAELLDVLAALNSAIEDARTLTFEISPPVLHELGLAAAIRWLAEQTAAQHGLKIKFNHTDWHHRLGEDLRVLLFQATREILFNIVKHAQATTVRIGLTRDGEMVRLAISDNGVGFDVTAATRSSRQGTGYGLFSIGERMKYLGGSMQVESGETGTSILLLAPQALEQAPSPRPDVHRLEPASQAADADLPHDEIRLVIADDQQLMRQGLQMILKRHPQLVLTGEAATGKEALELARRHQPDVVIMDIDMPELNGIEATRAITTEMPAVRVIALSMFADKQYVGEMLRAGANGYLLKDCAGEDLIQAIRAVNSNLTFFSAAITKVIVDEFLRASGPAATLAVLTDREREVLGMLARDMGVKEIALELDLNPKTIYSFRTSLMQKLGIGTQSELVKFAIRTGLTEVDEE